MRYDGSHQCPIRRDHGAACCYHAERQLKADQGEKIPLRPPAVNPRPDLAVESMVDNLHNTSDLRL